MTTSIRTEQEAAANLGPNPRRWFERIQVSAGALGPLFGLLILIVIAIIKSPGFLSTQNFSNLLLENAPTGIVALAMTLVIISGEFDLSVGGIFALASVFYAKTSVGLPIETAFALTMLVAIGMGLLNAIVIVRLGINSFVGTLGSGSIFAGLAYVYAKEQATYVTKPGFTTLGLGSFAGIPWSAWIMVGVFVIGTTAVSITVYGSALRATGGNRNAAGLAGIRVGLVRTGSFVLVAVASAVAGIIFTSEVGVGQPNVGSTLPLDAIAIVIIGGTSLFGGEGSMARTLVGLAIIATLTNVFNSLAINSNGQLIVKGLVLIAAAGLDVTARTKRSGVGWRQRWIRRQPLAEEQGDDG